MTGDEYKVFLWVMADLPAQIVTVQFVILLFIAWCYLVCDFIRYSREQWRHDYLL